MVFNFNKLRVIGFIDNFNKIINSLIYNKVSVFFVQQRRFKEDLKRLIEARVMKVFLKD